jgi:hypothetical protein
MTRNKLFQLEAINQKIATAGVVAVQIGQVRVAKYWQTTAAAAAAAAGLAVHSRPVATFCPIACPGYPVSLILYCNQVVAPGDAVQALPEAGKIRIGPGLRAQEGFITAQKCGIVRKTKTGKLWLEGRQKRCVSRWTAGWLLLR